MMPKKKATKKPANPKVPKLWGVWLPNREKWAVVSYDAIASFLSREIAIEWAECVLIEPCEVHPLN